MAEHVSENEQRQDFFEMTNVCTCTDENGEWLGECVGCWEYDLAYLNEWLGGLSDYWHVRAEQIGWRNGSGEGTFFADGAEEWIRSVTGFDCEWTFRVLSVVWDSDHRAESLVAKVYHHDSPTGEPRFIKRLTWDEFIDRTEES